MEEDTAAAAWLAEAFETGNPLAPLPAALLPADASAGERIALAVLDRLGAVPCGLRLTPAPDGGWVAGPMLEGRLLAPRTPLLPGALRHARASAALIAVLAEELRQDTAALPAFAALHPAIDLAATRLRDPPASAALLAADLGGLGHVVAGRRAAGVEVAALREVPVAFGPAARRPRPVGTDLLGPLERAAAGARRLGGLPAGAVLVVAGLSPRLAPEPGARLAATLGPLGRVTATIA